MSRWEDVITLISQAVGEPEIDANGYPILPAERPLTVYCNQRSVGMSEFYQAAQSGYKVDLKVEVRSIDYNRQKLAEFNGKRFRILRTYSIGNGEYTELTLSDISEKDKF